MRRVVITGAGSGIGLATARWFLEQGDEVHGWGRTAANLDAAADALADAGELHTHTLDVTDDAATAAAFESLGKVDVFVANAGICKQARLHEDHSDDVWAQSIAINLTGAYIGLKYASRHLNDGGSIVTVSSGLGKNARAGYEAYCASKHGLLGLTKCVALELAPRGIRVNAVCPGWVDTKMSRADVEVTAERLGVDASEFAAQAVEGIPLGTMVTSEDVAQLIGFLASPKARTITGQSYNISGGEFSN